MSERQSLYEALGPKGDLEAWLEVRSENEIRAAILALPNVNSKEPGAEGNRQDEKEAGSLALQPVEPPQPVAKVTRAMNGAIALWSPDGSPFDMSKHVGQTFYAAAPPAAVPAEPRDTMLYDEPADLTLAAVPAQPAEVEDPGPMLDDEGRAMVGTSHHYTAENIRALIADLKAEEAGHEEPAWEHRDHRARAGVIWRVMSGLACDVPLATQPADRAEPAPLTDAQIGALADRYLGGYPTDAHVREFARAILAAGKP